MTDPRRKKCKGCGRHVGEVGELSWNGKCVTCWSSALETNVEQMRARSGPNFARWRRAMAASVGGVLLDDTEPVA